MKRFSSKAYIEGSQKRMAERMMKEILKSIPESERVEEFIEIDIEILMVNAGTFYVAEKLPENCKFVSRGKHNYYSTEYFIVNQHGTEQTVFVPRNTHFYR